MLLFLDISAGELLIIVIAMFVVFGPRRMPEIARKIGKGMNELRKVTSDITKEFREGTAEIRKEVDSGKEVLFAEAKKMGNDLISGPSRFPEDPPAPSVNPETNDKGDIPPPEDLNAQIPDGPVARN